MSLAIAAEANTAQGVLDSDWSTSAFLRQRRLSAFARAHRLSTIRDAELLARQGLYPSLYGDWAAA